MKQLKYLIAVAAIAVAFTGCVSTCNGAAGTPQQTSCSVGN